MHLVLVIKKSIWQQRRTQLKSCWTAAPPSKTKKPKFKKRRFCGYYNIKRVT
jgi:hypothetical protein